jgi:hypothetical protein
VVYSTVSARSELFELREVWIHLGTPFEQSAEPDP